MVALVSKVSSQITFPGSSELSPILGSPTVTAESGVAVFNFVGTNPHDWTRDTLSFPIGRPCTEAEFSSGIATASPTSFWTPLSAANYRDQQISVDVSGQDSTGGFINLGGIISVTGIPILPPLGVAVDNATVSYSNAAGQPVLTLALAVFGVNTEMQRLSYMAHIVAMAGGIGGGGGGVFAPPKL